MNVAVGTASIDLSGLTTTAVVNGFFDTMLDPNNRLFWLTGYRLMTTGATALNYVYLDGRFGTIQIFLGGLALSSGVTDATFLVYYTYTV